MKKYVLVYPKQEDKSKILLVLKDRPQWQKGRLNLVGGKIEPGETEYFAANRELEEESGIIGYDLELYGEIIGIDSLVYCYVANVYSPKIQPREGETEKVEWFDISLALNDSRLMPNLKIAIPLFYSGVKDWKITDKNSSTGSLLEHDVLLSLRIDKPFLNG